MRIIYTFLLFFIFSLSTKAQELYVIAGKNSTRFDYKSTNGTHDNLNFRTGAGNNYEIGYIPYTRNARLIYSIGLVYNEFNSKASIYNTNYSWETKYIGISNKVAYLLYDNCFNQGINAFITLGLNTSILASGDQYINNYYYNLAGNDDFSGVNLQPLLGFKFQYEVLNDLDLTLGYNFSKTFHLFNTSDESVSFNTHQFQFGLSFFIY